MRMSSSFFPLSSALSHQYHFVKESKTWNKAQSYCRINYTDLATLYDTDDVNTLIQLGSQTGSAWIGLYDDVLNSWRWSITNSSFYGVNDTYVLITTILSWNDAQAYCRANYIDLPSIRNSTENQKVLNAANGNNVCIGLYRTRTWSDGSESSFRHWKSGQPDNTNDAQPCTAVSFSDSGQWTDEDCTTNLFPFFCYSGKLVQSSLASELILTISNTFFFPCP
ncbi:C-type mannose receptor 2-like [Alosa alosa]|uniref:C-type mannose receptor 2-like n=1 Tax=Alosa alosa TaxID=278164 RepID=UPI00201513B8|nr:C-type mannose receptor 2-like [Alosa alosa]